MSRGQRVELCAGYLLHQRPFRDSSLILDLYTRDHGRLTAFARGVRGPRSRFSGLQPFQPLLLSWSGRGEAPTLTGAECDGPAVQLPPAMLMGAFYLNELLLRLTTVHDPHPELFDDYAAAVLQLQADAELEPTLRRFELQLLEQSGYGVELDREAGEGEQVQADAYYHLLPGVGLRRVAAGANGATSGRVLLELAAGTVPGDADGRRQARALLRTALDHGLEGRVLASRTVARAVARIESRRG
jgi:DNA repair protein RecO (recombination protein O)